MKTKSILLALVAITMIACTAKQDEAQLLPVKQNGKYGAIDKTGEMVIKPQFARMTTFHEGLAVVSLNDKTFGYADTKGELVILADYPKATIFSDGVAFVLSKEKVITAINKKGEVLFTLPQAQIVMTYREGLAPFKDNTNRWGYVDTKGKVVIAPQFDEARRFSEGLAAIEMDGLGENWGYIDKKGNTVIKPQFQRAADFSEGLAGINAMGRCGFFNKKGTFVITPQFDGVGSFHEGLASVSMGRGEGFINTKGDVVISTQFKTVGAFNKGLASARLGNTHGYIDTKGVFAVPTPLAIRIFDFYGDMGVIVNDGKAAVVDRQGNYIANFVYEDVCLPELESKYKSIIVK